MEDARSITLTPEIAGAVNAAAAWRGMTVEQYVRKVVAVAAQLDAELAADIKDGEDDLAGGRFYTQEEVEAMFAVKRERRRAA